MNVRDDRHPLERISALLDDELDAKERVAVEAHLRECAGCRAFLEGLRTVARAAASEEPPPVPAGLADRIAWGLRAKAPDARRRPMRPWWRSPVSLSAAATLAAFGILFGVWRLERGEPGIPELPVVERPSAVGDRLAVPMEKKEADASHAAPSGKAATPPLDGAPENLPQAAAKQPKAPEEVPAPPAPPEIPKPEAGPSYAPSPSPGEAAAQKERADGEAVGGVVGGVLGGVVGGVEGGAETSNERATVLRGAKAARSETTPVFGTAPPAAPAEAKYKGVLDEKNAHCPSVWNVSPPEGWTLKSADPEAAGAALARLAARLGGRAEGLPAAPGSWLIEVPRGRWPELATTLRDLGVAEADPQIAVPDSAACVEARLAIAP